MANKRAQKILEIKERIEEHFTESDWQHVGLLTGHDDVIDGHDRLLRSKRFGDDDYGACIISVLSTIDRKDPNAIGAIEEYLNKRYPLEGEYISSQPASKSLLFAPQVFKVPEDTSIQDNLVSVMMPFSAEFRDVHKAIKKGCTDAGFECKRVDDLWENPTIIQDIFELILRSRVVITDFSGKNPNVMYETGIAHTLGRDVIPIVQHMADIPFDTQHHRVERYHSNTEGLEKLSTRLTQILKKFAER